LSTKNLEKEELETVKVFGILQILTYSYLRNSAYNVSQYLWYKQVSW